MIEIIKLDLRISIPDWMLDPSHCACRVLDHDLRIDFSALHQLREIVDLQLAGLADNNMGSQSNLGERHGQEASSDPPTDS